MGGPGVNARNKMQALTRPSKQEGGAWLKLVKNETTFFSLLVSNSSSSLKQSNSVKQNYKNVTFFQNSPLTLRLHQQKCSVGKKNTVLGTGLAGRGCFEKYIEV